MFLRDLISKPSDQLVGLDLSSKYIKILSTSNAKEQIQVENFSVSPMPANAIVNGELKDFAAASAALKNAFNETGIKSKCVAFSIPRSLAIIKTITIDRRLTSKEINSRAWVEANRNFPELVGNIFLDYVILGPASQDETQLELLLVACRKDQINPYLELFRMSSLIPKIVDLSSYAFERSLSIVMKQTPQLDTVALLNLDVSLSTLIVIHKNNIIYAQDESYDGLRLIELLKDAGQKQEALKDNLSSQLRHKMHFFYSSRPNITIQKMVISGDCAAYPDIVGHVQQASGIETVVADPFKDLVISSNIDKAKLKSAAPSLMLSFGLALSEIKEVQWFK